MASKRGCTPLFLKELPHSIGTPLRARVIRRTASCIWGHITLFTLHILNYTEVQLFILERWNTYFDRWDRIEIVTVFSQQQFGKLIIQISNLWLRTGIWNGDKSWGVFFCMKYCKCCCDVLYQVPVRLKLPWPLWPPARVLAHPTGQEVCSQTAVHHLPKIWVSTEASDWLTNPPHPKSFCHCRQASMKQNGLHNIANKLLPDILTLGLWK